jgi:hypothetical protein
MSTPDSRNEHLRNLSPDSKALLAEIMRQRRDKATAEIARLQEELRQTDEWLAEHAPDTTNDEATGGTRGSL